MDMILLTGGGAEMVRPIICGLLGGVRVLLKWIQIQSIQTSKAFINLLFSWLMETNKVLIRPRLKIYEVVEKGLYDFARMASSEELASATLLGLRLWYEQEESRRSGAGRLIPQSHHGELDDVRVETPHTDEPVVPALDLEALDLVNVVVHSAKGG